MPGGYSACTFAHGGVHESFRVRNRRSSQLDLVAALFVCLLPRLVAQDSSRLARHSSSR